MLHNEEEIAAAIEAFGYSIEEATAFQQNNGFVFYGGLSLVDLAYELTDTGETSGLSADELGCDTIAEELASNGYHETTYGVIKQNNEEITQPTKQAKGYSEMKIYDLNKTIANYETVSYFYKREKNDVNGNPRFSVYIIDPDGAVYESLFKCYEGQIKARVSAFVEEVRETC